MTCIALKGVVLTETTAKMVLKSVHRKHILQSQIMLLASVQPVTREMSHLFSGRGPFPDNCSLGRVIPSSTIEGIPTQNSYFITHLHGRAFCRIFPSNSICGPILSKLTEFAASMPEPATAGTPIPGKVLSPQTNSCFTGVPGNGKLDSPARIAGP
jgi:hypothetical protein